ncbi:MAG: glycosyltransferase family 4 protein [Puniceicoccaceae bacterium]
MWAIDLTHTTHTGAQTGIQQVCRNLARELQGAVVPIVYDRFAAQWRGLDNDEKAHLVPATDAEPPARRSSRWSTLQKARGYFRRVTRKPANIQAVQGLFCPEIFDPSREAVLSNSTIFHGLPRVAYFYDAIALKHPQWTPARTVERFPAYLRKLAEFDHVTCISEASRADLLSFWDQEGIVGKALTSVIPLGLRSQLSSGQRNARPDTLPANPVVLMVGTLEARKNHLGLLEACEELWASGMSFKLRLAGMLNRETGSAAADRIRELTAKGRPIKWEGAVSNRRLLELFEEADIFTYPSLHEGFGMPVLEALSHGLPVVTTRGGALEELAEGGGCLVSDGSPAGIRSDLESLLKDADLYRRLSGEASRRPVRTMRNTAEDLLELFQELMLKPSC